MGTSYALWEGSIIRIVEGEISAYTCRMSIFKQMVNQEKLFQTKKSMCHKFWPEKTA
jgi:hypothetical protein